MKATIKTKPIYDLLKDAERLEDAVKYEDGRIVNLSKESIFIDGGPFLHQATAERSEKESAAFERNNKRLFDFLRSLGQKFRRIL